MMHYDKYNDLMMYTMNGIKQGSKPEKFEIMPLKSENMAQTRTDWSLLVRSLQFIYRADFAFKLREMIV